MRRHSKEELVEKAGMTPNILYATAKIAKKAKILSNITFSLRP